MKKRGELPPHKLITNSFIFREQYQPNKTATMIAQILRYVAAFLQHLADFISPAPEQKKGVVAAANRCRERKNDIFLTPEEVAKHHIESVAAVRGYGDDTWVDPFRNTGVYYDNFPEDCYEKDWCEILRGRDALTYDYEGCIVCSNPPYSLITPLLERMVETHASVISLLIGCLNVSTPRLNKMREAGYVIVNIQLYNVKGYMGTSFAITWMRKEETRLENDIIGFNYKRGGYKTDQTAAMRT